MSFAVLFRSLPGIVRRYESTLASALAAQPSFGPYPTTAALVAALSLDSPLPLGDRQELVRSLVTLYRSTGHPLWTALLLHAFRPMLLSLRARDRGAKEDRDSRIVLAFLQALARTPLSGQPVFIALRRATERPVFQSVRAQRAYAETELLDAVGDSSLEIQGEPAPFTTCLVHEIASRVRAAQN